MTRKLAVLLAVLVITAAAADLQSPSGSRLDRRSSPSQDEAGGQKRANLVALLDDGDDDVGERLTAEEAEALMKYLKEAVGGLRRPLHSGRFYQTGPPRVGGTERGPSVDGVEREKKAPEDLSWLAQSIRASRPQKAGFIFRYGKRGGDEGEER
ncbi:PREDICTED: uncharacterized protein LOC109485343 [Branchiostoma belcheri]|uniref:Uncharacterized protein LOC109485343 n=1 Tax=Branchiostoma belcheri TaxID=7741 RepID=A0A6P5AN18_BRABE|nr:PREDICTED: uncharacterized protein LOC109485343 [Branchiostoma belcheri]